MVFVYFYFTRPMTPMQLDNYYASILVEQPGTTCHRESYSSDSEGDVSASETHSDNVPAVTCSQVKPAPEILNELAAQINADCLTKFNIARNFIWEGAKRAVSRKVFSPANKVSVKFTDDTGISEGAIDWGGPMREFFTLILQCIHDSQLMCGPESCRFLSYNVVDDVKKMVAATSQWFVLGRCKPALESFREGLSALGVLEAVKRYPDSFRPLFCDVPEKLTAERMEQLFRPTSSPVGSSSNNLLCQQRK